MRGLDDIFLVVVVSERDAVHPPFRRDPLRAPGSTPRSRFIRRHLNREAVVPRIRLTISGEKGAAAVWF